jgi:hypothetical protein
MKGYTLFSAFPNQLVRTGKRCERCSNVALFA